MQYNIIDNQNMDSNRLNESLKPIVKNSDCLMTKIDGKLVRKYWRDLLNSEKDFRIHKILSYIQSLHFIDGFKNEVESLSLHIKNYRIIILQNESKSRNEIIAFIVKLKEDPNTFISIFKYKKGKTKTMRGYWLESKKELIDLLKSGNKSLPFISESLNLKLINEFHNFQV